MGRKKSSRAVASEYKIRKKKPSKKANKIVHDTPCKCSTCGQNRKCKPCCRVDNKMLCSTCTRKLYNTPKPISRIINVDVSSLGDAKLVTHNEFPSQTYKPLLDIVPKLQAISSFSSTDFMDQQIQYNSSQTIILHTNQNLTTQQVQAISQPVHKHTTIKKNLSLSQLTCILPDTPDFRFVRSKYDISLRQNKHLAKEELVASLLSSAQLVQTNLLKLTNITPSCRQMLGKLATEMSISKVRDVLNIVLALQGTQLQHCLSDEFIAQSKVELGLAAVVWSLQMIKSQKKMPILGLHFDDTSKEAFDKAYSIIILVAIFENQSFLEVPLRLVELNQHNNGSSLAQELIYAVQDANSFLYLLNLEKFSLYDIKYLTSDNANINVGDEGGAMALFENQRKAEYNGSKPYEEIFRAGCKNHAIQLTSKYMDASVVTIAAECGFNLKTIQQSTSDLQWIAIHLTQKLRTKPWVGLFLHYENLVSTRHMKLTKVTETRWLTVQTALSELCINLPCVFGFLSKFGKYDAILRSIYALLLKPEVIIAIQCIHRATQSMLLPFMDLCDNVTDYNSIRSEMVTMKELCSKNESRSQEKMLQYLQTTFVFNSKMEKCSLEFLNGNPCVQIVGIVKTSNRNISYSQPMSIEQVTSLVSSFETKIQALEHSTQLTIDIESDDDLELLEEEESNQLKEFLLNPNPIVAAKLFETANVPNSPTLPSGIDWMDPKYLSFAEKLIKSIFKVMREAMNKYELTKSDHSLLQVLAANRNAERAFSIVDKLLSEKSGKMRVCLLLADLRIKFIVNNFPNNMDFLERFKDLKLKEKAREIIQKNPSTLNVMETKAKALIVKIVNEVTKEQEKKANREPEEKLYHYLTEVKGKAEFKNSKRILYVVKLKSLYQTMMNKTTSMTKVKLIEFFHEKYSISDPAGWNQSYNVEEDQDMPEADASIQTAASSSSYNMEEVDEE